MRTKIWIFFGVALCLEGCVRSQVNQIDLRTAIIESHGTAFDSQSGVQIANFVKAAQLTRARGFRDFAVLNAQNTSTAGVLYTPGQTTTNAQFTSFGNTGYGTATTTSTPATAIPFLKPGENMMIRMFKEGEIQPNAPGVWDAVSVLAVNSQK